MARRGPVAHYRLSRNEYQNTIYDLLGVYYDVNRPGVFNQDPLWHGFDHIGSMLSLSPSHVDHYFKAAEEILEASESEQAREVQEGPQRGRRLPQLRRRRTRRDSGSAEGSSAATSRLRYLIWPGGRMPGFNSNWLGPRTTVPGSIARGFRSADCRGSTAICRISWSAAEAKGAVQDRVRRRRRDARGQAGRPRV